MTQRFVGVTGPLGCRKSYVCSQIVAHGLRRNIVVCHIDCDALSYQQLHKSGYNTRVLANMAFQEKRVMEEVIGLVELSTIEAVKDSIMNNMLADVFLVDSSLFLAGNSWWLTICNWHVLFVCANKESCKEHMNVESTDTSRIELRMGGMFGHDMAVRWWTNMSSHLKWAESINIDCHEHDFDLIFNN